MSNAPHRSDVVLRPSTKSPGGSVDIASSLDESVAVPLGNDGTVARLSIRMFPTSMRTKCTWHGWVESVSLTRVLPLRRLLVSECQRRIHRPYHERQHKYRRLNDKEQGTVYILATGNAAQSVRVPRALCGLLHL
ncbi:hypothetical protein DFH06DRAFT_1332509 [Mycena polygramma]|nr:hypothetical protein DFH06DRAFT_1332509 [Mycena polygramma]